MRTITYIIFLLMVKLLPAQRYAVQYTMNQLEKSSGIKIVINTYLNGNGLTSIYEEDFENRKTHFSEDHVDFSMNNNVLYFKDFDSNTIFYKDQIRFKFFVIKDLPEKINWKLINEYKTILGYTCQKASCHFRGRLFDVYFSTDLPISDGPWKLSGLPGLILEVNSNDDVASFSIIAKEVITAKTDKQIENPYKGKELIDFKQFKAIYTEKYEESLHQVINAEGETRPMSKGFFEYYVE